MEEVRNLNYVFIKFRVLGIGSKLDPLRFNGYFSLKLKYDSPLKLYLIFYES
ncbi:hypothetical protein GCM10010182_83050 [Actinomadura cremea]|nr:hypothetical protein GCM10010182_83050 [Actinomadura cremea]